MFFPLLLAAWNHSGSGQSFLRAVVRSFSFSFGDASCSDLWSTPNQAETKGEVGNFLKNTGMGFCYPACIVAPENWNTCQVKVEARLYHRPRKERGHHGSRTTTTSTGVQDKNSPRRAEGGQDLCSVIERVRRFRHSDQPVEEAAPAGTAGSLSAQGANRGHRRSDGFPLPRDRSAQNGTRPAQKNQELTLKEKRTCVDPVHPLLSIRRQCDLLGLKRSSFYYGGTSDRDAREPCNHGAHRQAVHQRSHLREPADGCLASP